ncbi:TIGR03084 family metal-binding protein [Prauserella halophila]|uniref:TIGR03084 family metal-binding protein n=1 Tax=Prauserella halophila TaxID=185641 RepID=A0ABP4GIH9_9PSEU|nr:TIGR03084 family metal-binding protein [Prauserella halophila]MCP2237457.1 TIGR03084 family protein [Prauserella halophila]
MADLEAILDDLDAESAELDELVAPLSDAGWQRPTPAEGWTIAHQIAHLTWTDDRAVLAARSPDDFGAELERAVEGGEDYVDAGAREIATGTGPADLLGRWRAGRAVLREALAAVPAGRKLPWYGPPMSPASMVTARLMETWAHGQDVADTLGVERSPAARLRHVVRIGVRTRDFAFLVHGRTPPAAEFRVELTAPDGTDWTFGPADATDRVTGSALDFCLLVTQRRHRDDTGLQASPDAEEWLRIAQTFAGPPGGGRAAGQFATGRAAGPQPSAGPKPSAEPRE